MCNDTHSKKSASKSEDALIASAPLPDKHELDTRACQLE